jgi:signal transduction histidine kinase
MPISAKTHRISGAQTTSILVVGSSVMLAMWIVVITAVNEAQRTSVQQLMIVLLASVATALLCGLVIESRCRAQRETELAAEQAKLESTNRQLEESKKRVEEASTAKSLFLANMSHELRTPLNAIIGFSEIIKDQVMGPAATKHYIEYAGDIFYSGQHLLALIANVLDISKIEAGKMVLDEELIEIDDLVRTSVALLERYGKQNRIALDANLPKEAPSIRGDKPKLRQVLIDLLSNAMKFSLEEGRVSLRFEFPASGELVMVVADEGIGMSPDEITIALEPFAQVDNTLVKRFEGTGIGLPLAKRLVDLHGGKLCIESVKHAGTTVRVYLPANRVVRREQTQAANAA